MDLQMKIDENEQRPTIEQSIWILESLLHGKVVRDRGERESEIGTRENGRMMVDGRREEWERRW